MTVGTPGVPEVYGAFREGFSPRLESALLNTAGGAENCLTGPPVGICAPGSAVTLLGSVACLGLEAVPSQVGPPSTVLVT